MAWKQPTLPQALRQVGTATTGATVALGALIKRVI